MCISRSNSLLTIMAAALLAACGANGGGNDFVIPEPYTVIGGSGGTVTSNDGKARAVFAAGALQRDEKISLESIDVTKVAALNGATSAYELKSQSNNVQLSQPARVEVLRDAPRGLGNSLSVKLGGIVRIHPTRGDIEPLADQRLTVDGKSNTSWAIGNLSSFGTIAYGTRLKSETGTNFGEVAMKWNPIAAELKVGVRYSASLEESREGFDLSDKFSINYSYLDKSLVPLRHIPDPNNVPDGNGFRGITLPAIFDYTGDSPAQQVESNMSTNVAPTDLYLRIGDKGLKMYGLNVEFRQQHRVDAAAPPPPPPPPPPSDDGFVVRPVAARIEHVGYVGLEWARDLELPAGQYVAGGTTNPGMHIIDLATGNSVLVKDMTGSPMFGNVPHMKFGQVCMFGYGRGTARTCYFPDINDFGLTEIGFFNVGPTTDAGLLSATPVDAPSGKQNLLWFVADGTVIQEYQESAGSEVRQRGLSANALNSWYRSGGTATGKAQSAYFNANADRVLVVRGEPNAPGQLWFGNPADPAGGMLVGSLGANSNDTRKIRCALPICAISSRNGLVTRVLWDGVNVPTIIGTIANTSAAVGIDVTAEGNNRVIRSADFDANKVTRTVVDVAGQIVTSVTKAVPQGCTNPGHVTSFVDTNGQTKSVVSCNGVDAQNKSALAILTDSVFFAN